MLGKIQFSLQLLDIGCNFLKIYFKKKNIFFTIIIISGFWQEKAYPPGIFFKIIFLVFMFS